MDAPPLYNEEETLNSNMSNDGDCGDRDSAFDQNSWIISVCLAIAAALVNNLGVNLQKLAWTKKQSESSEQGVYRAYWLMGIVGIILASLFDFAALAFGPQSVIAPLGSLTMVANAFIAPWMHGETLHKSIVSSTIIIIIGCVMSVATASHSNEVCGVEALFALYATTRFVIYAVLITGILLAGSYLIKRFEKNLAENGEVSLEYQRVFKFHRFLYPALSGIFGAQSVLFAKSVDELIVSGIRDKRYFLSYPGTYIVIGCMAGSIFFQIYWLNQGLARFESLYIVPVFTSTWIVFTSVAGGVMYGEFSQFSFLQAIMFPFGVFLCCFGVFILSSQVNGSSSISPDIDDFHATELDMMEDTGLEGMHIPPSPVRVPLTEENLVESGKGRRGNNNQISQMI